MPEQKMLEAKMPDTHAELEKYAIDLFTYRIFIFITVKPDFCQQYALNFNLSQSHVSEDPSAVFFTKGYSLFVCEG
jgi:hypothetical protein